MSPLLVVALDLPSVDLALSMANAVRPHVDGYKVGYQLLHGPDPHPVEKIVELGLPVFVDAKLHDIPATVEAGARQLGRRGARWVTAHASGGSTMLSAAVSGLREGSDATGGVLAITVLTSLDSDDLVSVGVTGSSRAQVSRLLGLATGAMVEGVVCSVAEAPLVKAEAPGLLVATPGIRPRGGSEDDQKRTASPSEAVAAGSDLLVVGRPITRNPDPVAASASIAAELSASV